RSLTNGLPTPSGSGLVGALIYHGLPAIDADEKNDLRQLIMVRSRASSHPRLLRERRRGVSAAVTGNAAADRFPACTAARSLDDCRCADRTRGCSDRHRDVEPAQAPLARYSG